MCDSERYQGRLSLRRNDSEVFSMMRFLECWHLREELFGKTEMMSFGGNGDCIKLNIFWTIKVLF